VLLALSRAEAPLSGSRVATLVPGASNPGVRKALGRLVEQVTLHLGLHDAERTTIALYGSTARGTGDEHSDIDLVLLTPVDDEPLVRDVTTRVERWTGNPCSVYELTPERLSELVRRGDPIVRSWLDDAVTLRGPDLRRLLLDAGAET